MHSDARYEGWDSGHEAAAKVFGPDGVAKALKSLQQLMDLLVRVGKKSLTQSARTEVIQDEFFESTVELPTYSSARQATPDRSDSNPGHPPLRYDNDERFREYIRSIDFEDDSPLDHMFEEESKPTAEQDTRSSTPECDSSPVTVGYYSSSVTAGYDSSSVTPEYDSRSPAASQPGGRNVAEDHEKDAAIAREYVKAVFEEYKAIFEDIKNTIDAVIILLDIRPPPRPWPGVES